MKRISLCFMLWYDGNKIVIYCVNTINPTPCRSTFTNSNKYRIRIVCELYELYEFNECINLYINKAATAAHRPLARTNIVCRNDDERAREQRPHNGRKFCLTVSNSCGVSMWTWLMWVCCVRFFGIRTKQNTRSDVIRLRQTIHVREIAESESFGLAYDVM